MVGIPGFQPGVLFLYCKYQKIRWMMCGWRFFLCWAVVILMFFTYLYIINYPEMGFEKMNKTTK